MLNYYFTIVLGFIAFMLVRLVQYIQYKIQLEKAKKIYKELYYQKDVN